MSHQAAVSLTPGLDRPTAFCKRTELFVGSLRSMLARPEQEIMDDAGLERGGEDHQACVWLLKEQMFLL